MECRTRIRLDSPESISKLRAIPISSLREYFLPEIPPEVVRFSRLTVRVQNCLSQLFQQGSILGLADLHNHTVGELLDTPNFGVTSLFDLLDAIQPFAAPSLTESATRILPASTSALTIDEVDEILVKKSFVSAHIRKRYLPEIARSATIAHLPLKFRTRGCLEDLVRDGSIRDATDLAHIEIDHLLKRANFGKLTFMDLTSALRPYMRDAHQVRTAAPVELLRGLEKLRNSSLCAKVRCDDPRFKRQLLALLSIADTNHAGATLATTTVADLASVIGSALLSAAEAKRALRAIKELRQEIRRSLHLKLERELSEVIRSELDERTAKVVSRVYGLDGRGGATLQAVGNEYRLTRERIRQVADRVKRLVKLQPYLPKLEMCLQFILRKVPNRAESIERLLVEHRLTANEFRLEGIRLAAELFNKPIRFEVTEVNGVRIGVRVKRPKVANEVFSIAHRSVSKSGVCAVSDIAERIREEREAVVGILITESSIRWLGRDFEWFMISDSARNRLLNLLRKVTAIAPTIDVGELRRALSKNYRLGTVPPRNVLAEFCGEVGWQVEGDVVSTTHRLKPEAVLSETERMMVAVLRERGPVLYRTEFQELCAAKGISRNTFSMYMWTNPLFSRVAAGVYALTGAHINPFDVENCLRRNLASPPTLTDCGWTSDARPWIALQMSPTVVASGVFPVPGSIRGFLLGRFVVEMADGTEVGKIQVAEQNSWGLGTLIRRYGVEPGDFIVLEFNLQHRRAKAFLGGAEIVESFCDVKTESQVDAL